MSAILGATSFVAHDLNSRIPALLRHHTSSFNTTDYPVPKSIASAAVGSDTAGKLRRRRSRSNRHSKFPTCFRCQQHITDQFLYRIRGQKCHESCAVCSVCSSELSDVCFLHEGKLFCPRDYDQLHATRCANCRQPMRSHELFMRAQVPRSQLNSDSHPIQLIFHVSCFACSVCQQPLAAGDSYTIDPGDGRLICRADYLCTQQGQSVSGPVQTQQISSFPQSSGWYRQLNGQCNTSAASSERERGYNTRLPDESHMSTAQSNCASIHTTSNKRIRTSLTDEQRCHLQRAYELNPRPPKQIRETLAQELVVPLRVVQVWFQNQRARDKRASTIVGKSDVVNNDSVPVNQRHVTNSQMNRFTPSPHTSVASDSYPEFGDLAMDNRRRDRNLDESSTTALSMHSWKPTSDSQWLVNSQDERSQVH